MLCTSCKERICSDETIDLLSLTVCGVTVGVVDAVHYKTVLSYIDKYVNSEFTLQKMVCPKDAMWMVVPHEPLNVYVNEVLK